MIAASLGVGVIGYRRFGHFGWVDALYNASMILTGMGPVQAMTTTGRNERRPRRGATPAFAEAPASAL